MRFGLQLAPLEGEALAESCAFMTQMAHSASECGYDVLVAPQHYSALPYRYPHAITLLARLAAKHRSRWRRECCRCLSCVPLR